MMIGPLVNALAIILGSVSGAFLGDRISANLRVKMPMIFGCCSMTLGIAMIVKIQTVPAVILSVLLGSLVGELLHLEVWLQKIGSAVKIFIDRFTICRGGDTNKDFAERFIPVLILFCASGTGIFGAMNEGMTGDTTLLMSKSFLDLLTAAIFATSLGYALAVLAIPQFFLQALLFWGAASIMPFTTPVMLNDFSACGGVIMLATGFRICGMGSFAVANMLPALFISMPISALWAQFTVL